MLKRSRLGRSDAGGEGSPFVYSEIREKNQSTWFRWGLSGDTGGQEHWDRINYWWDYELGQEVYERERGVGGGIRIGSKRGNWRESD